MKGPRTSPTPAHSPLPDSTPSEKEVTMGHLKDSIHIDAPVAKVWEFTHDLQHWPTFMVGMSGPDNISATADQGTAIAFTDWRTTNPLSSAF
jgi:uncharacterized membrane protein